MSKIGLMVVGFILAIALNSCSREIVSNYTATAVTTYTWQVEYELNDKRSRFEEFASNSLVNVNGIKPEGAFGEVDDKGLWWPSIPPKPTLDEIEEKIQSPEKAKKPGLLREVEYTLTYQQGAKQVTYPTNYSVYRQAVKAHESGQALKLTLGINDDTVEKAEPQ